MKIQTRIYSRKLPESIQNAISFDIIQVKNFKTFMERPSLVVILCLRQWHIFQKWGIFQRSKGRGHEKFSRGQAPGPPPWLASLAPPLSSPIINFVPTGLFNKISSYIIYYLSFVYFNRLFLLAILHKYRSSISMDAMPWSFLSM